MKWKLFFQIVALIIITAITFYIVHPKHDTGSRGSSKFTRVR